ncbi:zf-HC2 domain-containing protein [Streptomyces sp. NPDC057638]|uniref:zf-HC2 domain-containing protein n=1 Tax=Streptomyces sp. NPDC057638 TaxID=3346190 RepID=UPI0036A042A2
MSTVARHQDVAAYALGVLDPGEALRFEEHLSVCVLCAVRLTELAPVASALSALGPPPVPVPPPPGAAFAAAVRPPLLNRLLDEVTLVRRRGGRRRLRLFAAAAVLAVGLPSGVLLADHGDGPPPGTGITATDAMTGVTATANVTGQPWGTRIALRLSGVRGPDRCRLMAVTADGTTQPVLSWRVGPPGHTAAKPLEIEGGTALARNAVVRWDVLDASGRILVSLPSAPR